MSRVLDQPEWQCWICDDLNPILERLKELYEIQVSTVQVDMKSAMADVYLTGHLSTQAIEALRQEFSSYSGVRFVGNWVSCLEHYCSIELATPR
jgi:hypothetical protein